MLAAVSLAVFGVVSPLRAQDGSRQWRFSVGGYVTWSSPALSPDGLTVYIGAYRELGRGGRVLAVSTRDGGTRWNRVLTNPVESSPAVGPDGTIYIGGVDGKLYALNPANGLNIWDRQLAGFVGSSPAIGSDGTIYVGASDSRLYAFHPNGDDRWKFQTGDVVDCSPAIASDGTIYVGSNDRNVYAISPAGQEKWRFATGGEVFASPAIGADGTVYVGSKDQRLYALTPAGAKKWDYLAGGSIESSPVLAADGAIYFAAGRNFYALNPGDTGERVRWRQDVATTSASSAAVRGDGAIIFGGDDGLVRALHPDDGREIWRFDTETGPGNLIESSPIIGPEGSIYIGSQDGGLYKINGNGSSLSRQSSWPAFRRDARRTARAPAPNSAGHLVNISTRAQAGGSRNLIAGFVVQAPAGRAYLIRGIGPALGSQGVAAFMPDPRLELFAGQTRVRLNDDWLARDDVSDFPVAETAGAVGAFPLPAGSKDSALVASLGTGEFTANVQSADGRPGIALAEIYDVGETGEGARLLNLSTRGFVGTGENVLIAGFVVGGSGSAPLLIRAIGPGLTQFGVPDVLPQPSLTVFSGSTPVARNTNWTSDGFKNALALAGASVGAFPLAEGRVDSALLFEANPGPYTIQISGVNGTTGEALVEIYVLP